MSVMNYQGYSAQTEYSEDDGLFVGHLVGVEDVVGFHAKTEQDLQAAFEEAVDDYLSTCAKLGRSHPRPE